MSSQLKKQLKHLGLSKGFHGKRGAKASLIYDPKDAANLSSQDIYTSCLGGYLELCRLDNRFEPFRSTLFAGVPKEREQRRKSEDENVQQSITAFCRLLTDHFLEPCTFKALEHLIRSYKVHEYSVDALMCCALPYHDTREFQRLLGVLQLEGTMWFWLKGVQEAGVALPRNALVTRCLKDMAFLRYIGEMAKCAASTEFHNHLAFSFYTVTVCEMIHAADKVTEEMIQCLIKYIFDGLLIDTEVSPDFRSSSYAVVIVLLENAILSNKLLSALVEALIGGLNEELLPQVLTIVCYLYNTQEQYTSMSSRAVKLLAKMDSLGTVLGGIMRQGLNGGPMLKVLMSHLLDSMHEKPRSMKVLEKIISEVPLSEALVGLVVWKVMDRATPDGGEEAPPIHEAHQKLMRLLDLHFPAELDHVVNKQFRTESSAGKKTTKSGKRKRGASTGEQHGKQQKLMGYLQNCLAGTLHQPVSNNCDLMLSLAVDAPQAQTRRMALEQLTKLVNSSGVQSHAKQFANNAILRRLEDDDFDVVHAAMNCPFDASHADVETYYGAVRASFDRAALAVWKEVSCEGDALQAAKQGVHVLGVKIAKQYCCKCEEAYAHLFGYLLIPGTRGQELSAYILQVLPEIPHPCMSAVSDYMKKSKCDVRNVLSQLPSILGASFEKTVEILMATGSRRTHHVLLIAMANACTSTTGEEACRVSTAAVVMAPHFWNMLDPVARNEHYSQLEGEESSPPAMMFTDTNIPTEEHLVFSADCCHVAAQITLMHLLHLSLRTLAHSNRPYASLETLHELLIRLLKLGHKQIFETHLLHLLNIVEISGVAKWEFLVRAIGLLADSEDGKVQASALQVLNKALKDASSSQAQKLTGETLLLMLPYVLASISSEENMVRKNGCQVLDSLAELLNKSSGSEGNELKKKVGALVKCPEMAIGNLKGDSDAVLRLTRKHLSTETGKELIPHLISLVYPHLKILSGKVCLFVVESLATDKADAMALASFLPLLQSLLCSETGYGVADASQIPTRISLELGRQILQLYTPANLKGLLDRDRKEFNTALDLLTATLRDTRDSMMAEDCETASFISDMKVLFCNQAPNVFGIIKDGGYRAQIFDTLLSQQTFGVGPDVKNAAKEALTTISIKAGDLLPHLMPMNTSQTEQASISQLLPPLCLPALEMIQWKSEIQGGKELLQAVEQLAAALMPAAKEPVVMAEERLDYPIRLCLSAMMILVNKACSAGDVMDLKVSLVVEFLRYAPDGSVRNLAMELLGTVASCLPNQTLTHVLEVLQLMGTTGIFEDDHQSRQVAAKALEATVPAWVHAGKGIEQLWQTAMTVLPAAHPLHRIPILESILKPMPQVEGVASAVLVILKEYLEKNSTDSTEGDCTWMLKVAQEFSRAVPLSLRAQAFSQCVKNVIDESISQTVETISQKQLPLLVIKFVSSEVKGFTNWKIDGNPYSPMALALSTTCESLLYGALEALSKLSCKLENKELNADQQREMQAISINLLHLVECLKNIMDPRVYIQSIVKFVESSSVGVMRHALKLYSEKMKEIEDNMATLSSYNTQDVESMASVALEICDPVIELIKNPESDQVMKQMGLAAVQSSVLVFGGKHGDKFVNVLECIPDVISEGSLGLKGSALATIAALVKGLGLATVPYLPKFAPMVLSATESAVVSLHIADIGNSHHTEEMSSEEEMIVLDLVGGLMVIREIVNHLGDFINPYLKQILGIVLNSKVQHCQDMGCGALAKAVAVDIAQCIPPRLLLKDLFGRLKHARTDGKDSLVQLMEVVGIIASKLNPKSATSYGDQIFMFLLKVLDVRQQCSLSIQATQAVEVACIGAFEQLVMKLTEKQFKPMFMKLMEWSHVKVESTKGSYLGRRVTFFQLVGNLVRRLRSLFVTYIDYFLEDSIKMLLAVETSHSGRKKVKEGGKKQEVSPWDRQNMYLLRLFMVRALHRFCLSDMGGFLTSEKLAEVYPALVHQFKVGEPLEADIQFLNFVTLDGELEGGLALSSSSSSTTEVDAVGIATISCLAKIAVMGGSEDLWKLVNSNVLKAAKKGCKYNRILVVEFVGELVRSLKEDFLPLVPETLPKLAEFLEDPETAVSNRSREVIRLLEALSGENYDEYLK